MKDSQTKVALNWVRDEIEGTLAQAQAAINAFAEDESDKTQIHFCTNCMHQVRGTLQMLEFHGAALLAEEMEALSEDIGEDKVTDKGTAYEIFLSAILKFKSYLNRYAEDKSDLPIILMSTINKMRVCRNEELVAVGNLIEVDIDSVEPVRSADILELSGDINREVKRIRSEYQQGLLGFIRDTAAVDDIGTMTAAVKKLWQLGERVTYSKLWWVAYVYLLQFAQQNETPDITAQNFAGKIDRRIKDLTEQKQNQVDADLLLTNLLFYIGKFSAEQAEVKEVQERFALGALMESLGDYEYESEELGSPDTDSIKVALGIIKEDIDDIKESLDLYIRTQSTEDEPLESLLPNMQKISDTMAILNLGQARTLIQEQMSALEQLLTIDGEERSQELISVVEAVLKLDDYINTRLQMSSEQLSQEQGDEDSLQVVNARYQLIQESRSNLQRIKDNIADYLDEDHRVERLENVPSLLKEVEGALAFSKLDTLKEVIAKTEVFVSNFLMDKKVVLSEQEVISLADAISSVDYYLEGLLSSGLHGLPKILQRAIDSVEELQSHYSDVGEEAPLLDDAILMPEIELVELDDLLEVEEDESDSLIDDEVREIFIEEAEEVLAELNQLVPSWKHDQNQPEVLSTIRRNFHTLKGSGRMVEAHDIGELGWAVENMLNRLIDSSIEYSPAIIVLVEKVTAILPAMVEDFAQGRSSEFPQDIADIAKRISQGEIITELGSIEEEAVASPEEELFDVFKQEAEGHVTNLEMFANQRVQGITQSHVSDTLLRSLHTLKGVAHISNIESLKTVIVPVESYFRELKSRELMAEVPDMALVAHVKDLLRHIIEQPDDESVITAHEEAILDQTAQLQLRFDEETQSEEDLGRDPELVKDLFNVAADVLNDLKSIRLNSLAEAERRDQVSYLMASIDRLDALSMSAELTEAQEITQALGGALQKNLANSQVDVSLDELLEQSSDQLENQFDCLAANLSVPTADELVQRLNDWAPAEQAPEVVEEISIELDEDLIQVDNFLVEENETEEAVEEVVEIAAEETVEEAAEKVAEEVTEEAIEETAEEVVEEVVEEATEEVAEVDQEILEIFIEEGEEIFANDAAFLESWESNPADLNPVLELQRNLHTLKGSARMAGFSEIGDLAHGLEDLYTGLADKLFVATSDSVNLAQKAEDQLVAMFNARKSGEIVNNDNGLLAQINEHIELAKSKPVEEVDEPTQEVEEEDALWDQELAEIFLVEANELLANFDEAIAQWSKDISNNEVLKPVVKTLHTLKGGARLSTLSAIANIAQRAETTVDLLSRDSRVGQSRWRDLLVKTHDQMHAMVTEVRNGILPKEANNLVAELDNDIETIKAQLDQLAKREELTPDEQVDVKVVSLVDRQKQKEDAIKEAESRDVIRVRSEALDNLVNLAGEASILRARLEQQVGDLNFNLNEVGSTVDRLKEQLRNLEIETEAQVLYRREISGVDFDEFDPLEMDRYTRQQELTRSLLEAASDMVSLQETLQAQIGDTEAALLQQSRINTELQDRLMRTRMVPFDSIESRLNRMVKQIAKELNKEVKLNLSSEGEMDRTVIERMVAPLDHMLRNAIDHGIESKEEREKAGKDPVGVINLSLKRRGNEVFIQIADDGAGINKVKVKKRAVAQGMIDESYQPTDRELYRLILQAGFSTAEEVTQISGRGVGMDVVHSEILQLGGSLAISSEEGQGTSLTVRLPFTLSSNQSLMVKVKGENYAIPLSNITTVARVSADEIVRIYQDENAKFEHLGDEYELRYLGQILDRNSQMMAPTEEMVPVLIIEGEEQPIAVHVDELLGSREVVVKSVGRQLSTVPGISGASILGDGSVVLILDMQTLVDRFHEWDFAHQAEFTQEIVEEEHIPTVMVVDDSITVRKVTSRLLQRHQYKVVTAKDGVDAVTQLNDIVPDVMLLDIEMPRMDGFELASLIRHDSRLKQIPIIMITSRTGEKHRQRAEEIGVNDYLGKPYNEERLLETITKMLELNNA